MTNKSKYVIIVLIIGVISITGCINKDTTNASSSNLNPDEIVVALGYHEGEPVTGFDPIKGWAYDYDPLIQSTLFRRNSNAEIINDLVTNYSISDDGLIWNIKIRNDAKFHDGTSLTAKDIVFTYDTASNTPGKIDLSIIEKITALDNETIEFTLKRNENTFIYKLIDIGIVPEHYYSENYGKNPIGSGPYKFVQWDKGQQVILERNEDYYGKKPYFKKLTLLFMTADTAYAAAKSGQIDILEIPAIYANQSIKGMKTIVINSVNARGITLPTNPKYTNAKGNLIGNNITSDIAIRKALNIGINREKMVDGALYGFGEKEYTGSDKLPWSNKEAIFKDANPQEAKKILDDAGWKDTNGDGILEKNGMKAEFKLFYPANEADRQALAVMFSEQAKELGINVIIVGTSWDKIDAQMGSEPVVFAGGQLDPYRFTYTTYYSKCYNPSSYTNVIGYNNSIVDGYLDKALTSADKNESLDNWKFAAWDGTTGYSAKGDAAWVWLVTPKSTYLSKENLDIGNPKYARGRNIINNIGEWKRIS